MNNEFAQATIKAYVAEINDCLRLTNRINDNNPRAAAKLLAKSKGNHSGAIKYARAAVNQVLASKGLPTVTENWEGFVKAPSWYKGAVTSKFTDNYVGGC